MEDPEETDFDSPLEARVAIDDCKKDGRASAVAISAETLLVLVKSLPGG